MVQNTVKHGVSGETETVQWAQWKCLFYLSSADIWKRSGVECLPVDELRIDMPRSASQMLSDFAADLHYDDIPEDIIFRAEELFLDWYASAIAGCKAPPVRALHAVATQMGPQSGSCRLVGYPETTSPLFAAMVNAAASHVVEQDDLHNQSILHPATVVFPAVLAVAQAHPELSGKAFLTAVIAGYECGIRVGQFLGKSHYRIFHMTGTAGTVGAAMAVSNLLRLTRSQTLHALGSAGTQAAGLWEFLKDAADSKQLHTAKASMDGLLAAYTAKQGLTAASQILEGRQGMAAGMLGEGDETQLTDRLGERWATMETSFKYHACCRHTHPAADALLALRNKHQLDPGEVKRIVVYVYQAAKDVLGVVDNPVTIHQSKFSMGFVLALILRYGCAGVTDFTQKALEDSRNRRLHDLVEMRVDPEIDAVYPQKWSARVHVEMLNGDHYESFVERPKGDPGNMLSRAELETKAVSLARYSQVMEVPEMRAMFDRIWRLHDTARFGDMF